MVRNVFKIISITLSEQIIKERQSQLLLVLYELL